MQDLASDLASPAWFPHTYDPGRDLVALTRLERADFARASFLDTRALSPQMPRQVRPFSEVSAAVREGHLVECCAFIFHIGHVGSTLVSRLLGQSPKVLALREPVVLRTLAESRDIPHRQESLDVFLKLLSRTFDRDEMSIVKATSFVSEIAGEIIARASQPRSLFLFVKPESYLATILGAENSPEEARLLAPVRFERLRRRLGGELQKSDIRTWGELVAMAWACEMTALLDAATHAPNRPLWLDFNVFLEDIASSLRLIFSHFGISVADEDIEAIAHSPELRRYSKAPEHAYGTELRNAVLNQARTLHGNEISNGLAWITRAAAHHRPIADLLKIAG